MSQLFSAPSEEKHEPGTEMESKARLPKPKTRCRLFPGQAERAAPGAPESLPGNSTPAGEREGVLLHKRHGRSLLPAPCPGPRAEWAPGAPGKRGPPQKASGGSAQFLNMAGTHSSAPACSRILRMRRR